LVLTLGPEEAEKLREIYRENGIDCCVIGEVMPQEEGIKIIGDGEESNLSGEYKDEIGKIL